MKTMPLKPPQEIAKKIPATKGRRILKNGIPVKNVKWEIWVN
jgi:hypothetical protein